MTVYGITGFNERARVLLVKGDNGFTTLSADAGLLDLSAYEDVRLGSVNGLLLARKDGKWGCIDATGEVVVPCELRQMPEVSADGAFVLGCTFDSQVGNIYYLYNLAKKSCN